MPSVSFKNAENVVMGDVDFEWSDMPFTCGFIVLGQINCLTYNGFNKDDVMRAFIEWITNQPLKNNVSLVSYYTDGEMDNYHFSYDEDGRPQSPLFFSSYHRTGRPLYARVILTDNEKGEYDTKRFAKLANLPEYPWARNPNSNNYVTHWYFDLVDDVK